MTASQNRYRALAARIATENGVPAPLFVGLVQAESAFNPNAVSSAGAIGLSQLLPGTAAALGVNPYDPVQNLRGGARYLKQQLDRFGSVEKALAAYNAGPGAVQRYHGVPPYAETQNYVSRVQQLAGQIAGRGQFNPVATATSVGLPDAEQPTAAPSSLFSQPLAAPDSFLNPGARRARDEAAEQIALLPPGLQEALPYFLNRGFGGVGPLGIPQVPGVPRFSDYSPFGRRSSPETGGESPDLTRPPDLTGLPDFDPRPFVSPGESDAEADAFAQRYRLGPLLNLGEIYARAQEGGVPREERDPLMHQAEEEDIQELQLPGPGEVEKIPGWQAYMRRLFNR